MVSLHLSDSAHVALIGFSFASLMVASDCHGFQLKSFVHLCCATSGHVACFVDSLQFLTNLNFLDSVIEIFNGELACK